MTIALQVFEKLAAGGLKMATAESCTGGLVAAAITDIAGSSAVFDRGFVTYSNAAKVEMIGVPYELIMQHGAVSEEVAFAMAQGALLHSGADIAVAITGIAGPTGGSDAKPVGLVYFAVATRGDVVTAVQRFGDLQRAKIRTLATEFALNLVLDQLNADL